MVPVWICFSRGAVVEMNRDRCISLLSSIKRPGMPDLIDWLASKSDYLTAPASTRHHGAEEGGLLAHSLAVYDCLLKVCEAFNVEAPADSKIIAALLHDLCKVNYYEKGTRNVKNDKTGKWETIDCYVVNDAIPIGHGEKSVIMLQAFIRLTEPEIMAIRWHMGGYDDAGRGGWSGSAALSEAQKRYPLAVALHLADMAASYFDKK